jgi:hypothetical protein
MMKKNNVTASKSGSSTLMRARFAEGMLLQSEDMEQLNSYTRELSSLLFKSFFGYGVVCGLVVSLKDKDNCGKQSIMISAGLALDCSGNPVHVPKPISLPIDDDCNSTPPDKLWVTLCGTSKYCSPRTAMCASDDDESVSVCTRVQEMFEIRLVSEPPNCACDCDPLQYPDLTGENAGLCWCDDPLPDCYQKHYDGECGCDGGSCGCDCECVLLAYMERQEDESGSTWKIDHRVRRFIRPVLMRDPQVRKEAEQRDFQTQQQLEMISLEMRKEKALKDSEGEKQQLQGQVNDSVMQARMLSQELESAKQRIMELQRQNADLERLKLQSDKSLEVKSPREGLRKASKKSEEKS